MYFQTSQRYKDIIYNPSIQSVVNIYIDDVLLNPKYLTDFKMGCELFNDNFELGSVPSQYVEMQIHKNSGITNPKTIKIEYGVLVNNALTVAEVNQMLVKDLNKLQVKSLAKYNNSFEMIPIGIYNVDNYDAEDDNVINIKALDNIIKLDADNGYYDASGLINEKGYATLGEIAQDICNKKGLELETSSFLNSNNKVAVYDNQLTAREYMSQIAEKAGGFCFANRQGKIEFRKIGQDTAEIPLRLFKTYKFGEEYKISRVAFEDGIRSFKFGDTTRNILWIRQDNLFVTAQEEIQNIYNNISGLTINSFEGSVIIDPAIDIGDKIKIGEKCIIYQGEMTLNKRFVADIKSKIGIKQKQETTVKKESQVVINRKVKSEIDEIDGKIAQLIEENTETSNKLSEHTQTIDSITETISSVETKIETVESKADTAQSTANTANTTANNAQTSANNAQNTADSANTNAQNAQNKANENATQIATTVTKLTQIEETVDGITQSVSEVEEKIETVESKADNAQSTANTAKTTADNINDNLTTNYYTKTEANSQINQKANEITNTVSQSISTAKAEAIDSANTNTDDKLKNYSTTSQMNSAITQKAGEINSEVSQKVDNLQIGGTNLIPNSAPYNLEKWFTNDNNAINMSIQEESTAPLLKSLRISTLQALTGEKGIYIIPTTKVLKAGQEYCFSIWLKSTANMSVKVGYAKGGQTTFNITTEWAKYTYKFIATEPTAEGHGFVIYLPSGTIKGRMVYIHSIKLEEGNKITAWCPAPNDNVTGYELGTKIEQNWEHIKYAWNQISQYLKMEGLNGKATLNIYDKNNKILMSLSQDGQTFYNAFGDKIGTIGIVKQNNKDTLAFAMNVDWDSVSESKSMAWGYFDKSGTFLPVFHLVGTYGAETSEYGGMLAIEGGLITETLKVVKNTIESGDTSFNIVDANGDTIFSANTSIQFFNLANLIFSYTSDSGEQCIDFSDCVLTNMKNVPKTDKNLNYISGSANSHIFASFKNGGSVIVFENSSDINLKKNIKKTSHIALDKVKKIKHKEFDWKSNNKHQDIGYIAQEMKEIDESFVHYSKYKDQNGDEKENWQINTLSVLATATKAIQEQNKEIEELKKKDKQKEEIIADLINRIETLEKGVSK